MRIACWSILMTVVAACGGDAGTAPLASTGALVPSSRDSAGVTILEHPGDALARAPRITVDSAPLAVFAGDVDDPSRDVSTLAGFAFTAAGDLVGIDRDAGNIVVLDPADGTTRRFGRKGSGPLELGSINRVAITAGDTILMTDGANARVLFATTDSGPVRTESYASASGARGIQVLGRTSTGAIMARRIAFTFDDVKQAGLRRRPMLLGSWRPGDDSLTGEFAVPGPLMAEEVQDQGGGRMAVSLAMLPLAWNPEFGVAGDAFVVARGDAWALEHWDTTGALTSIIRIDRPPQPVTAALWERYVNGNVRQLIGRAPTAEDTVGMSAKFLDQAHADTLPAYGRISVTPSGITWVPDYGFYGEPGWAATAIAPDGRILGRIEMDSGEAPIAWGDDRVAFRSEDQNGIATITIKRLRMPE